MSLWLYCPDCKEYIGGLDSCCCGWKEPPSPEDSHEYRELQEENDRLTRELAEAKARAIPNGWVAVPARLTAENGAKAALIGEFYEVSERECTACDEIDEEETCDVCEGSGIVVEKVAVSWSTIKEIHSRVVALFARPELPRKESDHE